MDTSEVQGRSFSGPARQRAYDYTKRCLLTHEFAPGVLISEGEVASALGVSRTPVREAFLRLETEGLLKLYPKRGALVPQVAAGEAEAVAEARLVIERHAAEKLRTRPEEVGHLVVTLRKILTEQRRLLAEGEPDALASADREFHRAIVQAAGNPVIVSLYDSLHDRQVAMALEVFQGQPGRAARSLEEHCEVIDALESGGGKRLSRALEHHVTQVLAAQRAGGSGLW